MVGLVLSFMLVLNLALIGYAVFKDFIYQKQIKDLTNRLMAKDINEYVALSSNSESSEENFAKDDDMIPIEQADIFNDKDKFIEAIRRK